MGAGDAIAFINNKIYDLAYWDYVPNFSELKMESIF